MHPLKTAVAGFGAGAVFMYFADPARGRRRRAVARDKAGAALRDVGNEIDKAARDLSNRTQGMSAAAQGMFTRAEVDGPLLEARVRSRIGRAVSHPHAVRSGVEAGGRVILEGDVLTRELDYLLRTVRAVTGVREVINRLEAHDEPNVASLQGGVTRRHVSEFSQENWTPILRVAATLAAGGMAYAGLRSHGPVRWAGAGAAAALLSRAIANESFTRMLGLNGRPVVEFDKTMHVNAPVKDVFHFWSRMENFPRFMTHLKEVHHLGNGQWHWVAAGPGGIPVSWDAEVVQFEPNRLLAWRSVAGSLVRSMGRVRFEADPAGGTRIGIRLSYCPPAGIFGHTVARLFAADPKSEIDDDMVRLKSLLETGKTRAHGETVTREEVSAGGMQSDTFQV